MRTDTSARRPNTGAGASAAGPAPADPPRKVAQTKQLAPETEERSVDAPATPSDQPETHAASHQKACNGLNPVAAPAPARPHPQAHLTQTDRKGSGNVNLLATGMVRLSATDEMEGETVSIGAEKMRDRLRNTLSINHLKNKQKIFQKNRQKEGKRLAFQAQIVVYCSHVHAGLSGGHQHPNGNLRSRVSTGCQQHFAPRNPFQPESFSKI